MKIDLGAYYHSHWLQFQSKYVAILLPIKNSISFTSWSKTIEKGFLSNGIIRYWIRKLPPKAHCYHPFKILPIIYKKCSYCFVTWLLCCWNKNLTKYERLCRENLIIFDWREFQIFPIHFQANDLSLRTHHHLNTKFIALQTTSKIQRSPPTPGIWFFFGSRPLYFFAVFSQFEVLFEGWGGKLPCCGIKLGQNIWRGTNVKEN